MFDVNRYYKAEHYQQGQFMVGLLVAIKERGLSLNLVDITENDIARLETKAKDSLRVICWAGDLFDLDDRGRYQNFRDHFVELCGVKPIVTGVAELGDVIRNEEILWIIDSLKKKQSTSMLRTFMQLSEALLPSQSTVIL